MKNSTSVFLLCLCWVFLAMAQEQDTSGQTERSLYRSSAHILAGAYDLKSNILPKTTGVGSIELGYAINLWRKISFELDFNNILKSGMIGNVIWGYDFHLQYCLANCQAQKQESGGVKVVNYAQWGGQIGAGVSQRLCQFIGRSVDFSGLGFSGDLLYFWNQKLKILGRVKYLMLSNGPSNTMKILSLSVGPAMSF